MTTTPQFRSVIAQMEARYATGVAQFVHSYINGMIDGLAQYGILSDEETQQLKIANQERLVTQLDLRQEKGAGND